MHSLPPRHLFHAVVWTEAAATSYNIHKAEVSSLLDNISQPIWGKKTFQILITPSGNRKTLPSGIKPNESIGLYTDFISDHIFDAISYCKKTVEIGMSELKRILPPSYVHKNGSNGIIIGKPSNSKSYSEHNYKKQLSKADDLFLALREHNEYVWWEKYTINKMLHRYYGVSLIQLTDKILEFNGFDPKRVLWICRLSPFDGKKDVELSIDWKIASYSIKTDKKFNKRFAIVFGKNNTIRNLYEENGTDYKEWFLDCTTASTNEIKDQIKYFFFSSPISLHHNCGILRKLPPAYKQANIFSLLSKNTDLFKKNITRSKKLFCTKICNNKRWYSEHCENDRYKTCPIFNDKEIFDHKSGAISFKAYKWHNQVLSINHQPWKKVVEFFTETLEVPWQNDRPNYRRILATPTTFIMRGEDYYSNLKNIFPLQRIDDLRDYTSRISKLISDLKLDSFQSYDEWKLFLALLDQLRNSALQFAWLMTNIKSISDFKDCEDVNLKGSVITFLNFIISAYYRCLSGQLKSDDGNFFYLDLDRYWNELDKSVQSTLKNLNDAIRNWRLDPYKSHLKTVKLLRRWREADHPGENLMVALQAIDDFCLSKQSEIPIGIGIGWGGIELPLVYKAAVGIITGATPIVFASHYSKYAKDAKRAEPLVSSLSDDPDSKAGYEYEPEFGIKCSKIIVFDDNSLSGKTIQKVVEDLIIRMNSEVLAVYLTRLSGERRYDHMRMEDHGVLNPDIVQDFEEIGSLVHGYLGETPFSRTWSRQIYLNPIGIFSLSKRRILELLHANSSANRFDREGF